VSASHTEEHVPDRFKNRIFLLFDNNIAETSNLPVLDVAMQTLTPDTKDDRLDVLPKYPDTGETTYLHHKRCLPSNDSNTDVSHQTPAILPSLGNIVRNTST
jgi:hypothetical protein